MADDVKSDQSGSKTAASTGKARSSKRKTRLHKEESGESGSKKKQALDTQLPSCSKTDSKKSATKSDTSIPTSKKLLKEEGEKEVESTSKLCKSHNKKSKRSQSTSSLPTSTTDKPSTSQRSHSDTTALRKRKKAPPQFSPKKLRSSAAKTGARSSRTRGGGGEQTNNIGFCASNSRRNRRSVASQRPSGMEDERNESNTDNTEETTNQSSEDGTEDGPLLGAMAALASSTGRSSGSQDGDSNLGLEDGDISRLQALLEARGLPAHLFGSLGPRMHLLLHKTFNSGAGTKAQQLIVSMQSEEEAVQLQGVMEMCQMLVMGNEETLGGFPAKQVVPILINLLQMEHNFDIMNHACRALTYLMEALPRSSVVVVDAVPALLDKLQSIQCMDVAEQALTALEMLSKRHGKNILQAGGLNSSLLFLDFFSIVAQRSALAITANCCQSVTPDVFNYVAESIETLSNRLSNQDKKTIESVCLAFTRLIDNLQTDKALLEKLCEHGLLANTKQLLLVSPPIISNNTFVMVCRMLVVMCTTCPTIAVKLLKLDLFETIQFLLIGVHDVPQMSTEMVELIPRSPQELYELTCLISELLPSLPTTGIFSIDAQLNKRSTSTQQGGHVWQWKDDRGAWHAYLWVDNRIIEAAHQSGEDEISLTTLGRNYIIDFTNMQQINEDTGTMRSIQRQATSGQPQTSASSTQNVSLVESGEDERAYVFKQEAEKVKKLVQSLIKVLYVVFYSSVGPAVKHKCLTSVLKMLYHTESDQLREILADIPISSYIAGMLGSSDLKVVCSALQEVDVLMRKLPDLYHIYFRREGVMHKIRTLAESKVALPAVKSSPAKEEENTMSRRNHSNLELSSKHREREAHVSQSNDLTTSHSAPKVTEPSKTKRRGGRKFTRQRKSREEDTTSPTTSSSGGGGSSKKLAEGMRPKSETFSSGSASSSKRSFFANFAPRWGRPQSLQNSSAAEPSSSVTEKSIKEHYNKEQEKNRNTIKLWINETAQEFYSKYFSEDSSHTNSTHPALNLLQRLTQASTQLSQLKAESVEALNEICEVLLIGDRHMGASPFEVVHSGIVTNLLRFLTEDNENRDKRIKSFLSVFLGIEQNAGLNSKELSACEKPALIPLVQKLNLCVDQLEQFPVKCHEGNGSGARGSSALRFFNTHQIKCTLVRHPECTSVKQWSGGAVKIDPLALVQAIERYLVVRGFGRVRDDFSNDMSDDEDRSDDEIEESWASQIQGSLTGKHMLEFSMNGHVLPYNMTVYQAVRQYAPTNEETSDAEEYSTFGRASIWSSTHVLHYRPVNQPSSSLLAAPKRSKFACSSRSTHKEPAKSADVSNNLLSSKLPVETCSKDPSLEVICLLRVIHHLNSHWGKYFGMSTQRNVVSKSEFINSKLTAKATRQLQDPLIIMTGNLPAWLSELAQSCPFVFPFECRQMLFYTTTFDRDRAVLRLQDNTTDTANDRDSNDRVAPRLDKKKRTVNRDNLFKQGEAIINDFSNNKSLMEIQYEGEVGTGLGPTLEFYTLLSKQFYRHDNEMWRGDTVKLKEGESDSVNEVEYCNSPHGLYPTCLPKNIKSSPLNRIRSRFRYLGKFVAKACMDSRMIDISLSRTFYKWLIQEEHTIDVSDLHYVDPTLYNSINQLHQVCLEKKRLESDPSYTGESLHLALSSLTLDGMPIEDLGLDFVLPGSSIELKKNGKDTIVTIDNLEEYINLVVEYSLREGVVRQIQAFKEGFEQFFPLKNLQMFYPEEIEMLLCGSNSEKWLAKDLVECCRPDHGYTTDSRAVQFLFEILCKYTAEEQRLFLQFITGSPKLPVGGFKSLNPPLTIVRKTVDASENTDNYLPSVMTCVNYLKLPDYSSAEVMRDKLKLAYSEGKNAFHLS